MRLAAAGSGYTCEGRYELWLLPIGQVAKTELAVRATPQSEQPPVGGGEQGMPSAHGDGTHAVAVGCCDAPDMLLLLLMAAAAAAARECSPHVGAAVFAEGAGGMVAASDTGAWHMVQCIHAHRRRTRFAVSQLAITTPPPSPYSAIFCDAGCMVEAAREGEDPLTAEDGNNAGCGRFLDIVAHS